jgi:hypothetical protein
MCDYFINYLLNLAASLTFVLLVIGAGWVLVRRKRRRLLQFFAVRTTRQLSIYFSLLRVRAGGAIGSDNRPRAFGGSAVPSGEFEFLSVYQRLFNYIVPALQEQPGSWRNLLLSDVRVEASPAPATVTEIDRSSSILCVGSPAYNIVSGWVESDRGFLGRFVDDYSSIDVTGVPNFRDPLHGFVQRVRIGDGLAMAFYVAGVSEQATKAAIYYLASRWEDLHGSFGDRQNFCVVIKADSGDHRKATVLMERRES